MMNAIYQTQRLQYNHTRILEVTAQLHLLGYCVREVSQYPGVRSRISAFADRSPRLESSVLDFVTLDAKKEHAGT